jgi:hypothetical protein
MLESIGNELQRNQLALFIKERPDYVEAAGILPDSRSLSINICQQL